MLLQIFAAALTPNADLWTLRRVYIGQQIITCLGIYTTHGFKTSLRILSSYV